MRALLLALAALFACAGVASAQETEPAETEPTVAEPTVAEPAVAEPAVAEPAAPPAAEEAGGAADRARALLVEGVRLRREGRDQEALELFERAQEIDPSPPALAQIAMVEQALGRLLAANRHLAEALRSQGDPWLEGNRSVLAGALERLRQRLGRLELSGGVPGAEVTVNGDRAGLLPLSAPVWAEAGSAIVVARAEGYHPLRRTVEVVAGSLSREELRMVERGSEEEAAGLHLIVATPGEDQAEQAFWGLAISGAASFVIALVTGGLALEARSRFLSCETSGCLTAARSEGRQLTLAADITVAAGSALALGALIAFLIEPDMFEQALVVEQILEAGLRIEPWVSERGGGLLLEGEL